MTLGWEATPGEGFRNDRASASSRAKKDDARQEEAWARTHGKHINARTTSEIH